MGAAESFMQDILQKVAELLIGAIPTALLFIVLVFAYEFLMTGPVDGCARKARALTGKR